MLLSLSLAPWNVLSKGKLKRFPVKLSLLRFPLSKIISLLISLISIALLLEEYFKSKLLTLIALRFLIESVFLKKLSK